MGCTFEMVWLSQVTLCCRQMGSPRRKDKNWVSDMMRVVVCRGFVMEVNLEV